MKNSEARTGRVFLLFLIAISFLFINACGGDTAGSLIIDNTNIFRDYTAIATGSYPEAIAIGDVNHDGRNDVVMTTWYSNVPANDYKIYVFLQNANGTLAAPVKYATSATYSRRPSTVAIGDINHDGRNDVVIGCSGFGIEVFSQNGSGALNAGIVYASADSNKIRIADLNHDGILDVVGIGWGTNTASV